jgi:lipoprotein signal peptidase
MKQYKNYFLITLSLILIDQLSKLFASKLGWSIFLNDQFAFSLPVPTLVMFIIYVVVFVGMSYYIFLTWQRFSFQQKIAWSFVFAGGLSNVVERIFLGHVRDFIPIANGMLNLADFFILIGLVLLLASSRRQSAE